MDMTHPAFHVTCKHNICIMMTNWVDTSVLVSGLGMEWEWLFMWKVLQEMAEKCEEMCNSSFFSPPQS